MKTDKRKIQVTDGTTIYYKVTGSGCPLFLLHGNGGSSDYFKHQIKAFSQFFTVYAVDSRGHGQSTNKAATLTFKQMAFDLKELLAHEQLAQIDIVGFSDGANLAMMFTAMYPTMVHRLVLNAGNTIFSGVKLRGRIMTYIQYGLFSLLSPFSTKAKRAQIASQLLLKDIGVTDKQLQQFPCETLVIVGKYDIIKRAHSLKLAKLIPHAAFVLIPHQGHSFAQKDPVTFNQEVLSFLLKSR
jgi:pimeloyl-ACP methyl ester carboxylesterase